MIIEIQFSDLSVKTWQDEVTQIFLYDTGEIPSVLLYNRESEMMMSFPTDEITAIHIYPGGTPE